MLPFLANIAGDKYIHFNPTHQATFLKQVAQCEPVFAGRFNAANSDVKTILDQCALVTIVQNPFERFYASYVEVCDQKGHPLHDIYLAKSLVEAAQYCIE